MKNKYSEIALWPQHMWWLERDAFLISSWSLALWLVEIIEILGGGALLGKI